MKKTYIIEFESLLQDKEFILLMNESPEKAEQSIEELCRQNPGKDELIRQAGRLVRHYIDHSEVDNEKITMMWNNILRKSKTSKAVRHFYLSPVWSVAASIVTLLAFTFYFFQYSNNNSIKQFADKQAEISDEAKIIISDGSEYQLKSNESHIKYDVDGKEIVIEEKNSQTEKIFNQPTESKALYNQIVVPYGKRHRVTLSDGTVVQLNSGSKLAFPAKFADNKREVYLKGEGFFEVAKDAKKPFIVNTDHLKVKVLGTHFNVSAYLNENSTSAVVEEGSVEVVLTKSIFNTDSRKINPGQGCFFNNISSELTVHEVDVNEYIYWKDGIFQFKDQSFESIIKKVEKYYNKKITIEDPNLSNRTISGKLVLAPNFEETIDFLAMTTRSRYVIKENGTYYIYEIK